MRLFVFDIHHDDWAVLLVSFHRHSSESSFYYWSIETWLFYGVLLLLLLLMMLMLMMMMMESWGRCFFKRSLNPSSPIITQPNLKLDLDRRWPTIKFMLFWELIIFSDRSSCVSLDSASARSGRPDRPTLSGSHTWNVAMIHRPLARTQSLLMSSSLGVCGTVHLPPWEDRGWCHPLSIHPKDVQLGANSQEEMKIFPTFSCWLGKGCTNSHVWQANKSSWKLWQKDVVDLILPVGHKSEFLCHLGVVGARADKTNKITTMSNKCVLFKHMVLSCIRADDDVASHRRETSLSSYYMNWKDPLFCWNLVEIIR